MTQVAIDKDVVAQAPAQPRRALGLWASMVLVVGNMIGSGIFLLPASLASFGGISIVGWVLTAVGAMFLALLFSRGCTRRPEKPFCVVELLLSAEANSQINLNGNTCRFLLKELDRTK